MLLKTAELINKKLPDAAWLYQTLFVLNSGHPIFNPNYRYVKQNKKETITSMPCFNNDDGFFNDAIPRESKGKKQKLMRLPKSEKLRMKKELMDKKLKSIVE